VVETWEPKKAFEALANGEEWDGSRVYADLLSRSPVAVFEGSSGGNDMWGIFGSEEIERAARDHETFSNVTVPDGAPRIIPLMVDPPEHTAYRRIINPFFGAQPIKAMEDQMRPIAIDLIDRMISAGRADFSQEYAYQISIRTLCRFLRVKEDWSIYNDWSREMEEATAAGTAGAGKDLPMELLTRVFPYIQGLIDERRANPSDDVISGFVAGEINGKPLDDQTITQLVMAIIMAGKSTTASGIGNIVLRLAREPKLQQFLRENPDRIPDAVEEGLRLESPQQEMPRKATKDVEVAGNLIKKGDSVFLNYGSGNLDPARWDQPGTFDLDRKPRQHLAFGRGMHTCFGAPLGRMQIKMTLEELLARTKSFELDGPVQRFTWPRLSVENMPLRFVAAD
jgi:cytochrome P450